MACLAEKTLTLGKTGQEKKGVTEDGMAGWHHQLNGHEFEHGPESNERQGGLECRSPRGHRDTI